jgi:hypothetical protein
VIWNKFRLSILDLIVLTAATALGIALVRGLPDYVAIENQVMVCTDLTATGFFTRGTSGMGWTTSWGQYFTTAGRSLRERPSYWLSHVPCWASPCLLSWTLAAMALGLREPRPSLRRRCLRPGMAAGLAMVLAVAIQAIESLRFLSTRGAWFGQSKEFWSMYEVYVLTSFVRLAGFSVAAWWLCLAVSRRWSAEVNSGGMLARVFGWCWIAMAVSSETGAWCFALSY